MKISDFESTFSLQELSAPAVGVH